MTDLVLLTVQFPYGTESETFLEPEVPILAEHFDRILIIPSATRDTMRPIPPNAEVVPMGWTTEPSARAKLAALASPQAGRVIRWSASAPADFAAHVKAPRVYADVLGRNVLKYRELRQFIRDRELSNAVFYDYWFENSTLALSLLRREGAIRTAVARAHNFEVFGIEYDGPPPFRQAKAVGLDAIFPTSQAAEAHLHTHAPAAEGKMQVHRLGVRDPGAVVPTASPAAPPLIVTCAILSATKRIQLVPEALAALDTPLRWVHIGDGPERARVMEAADRFLAPGTWQLAGQMPNPEVHEFYRTHPVRVLLSLSESEGLPVSMMEALSYGVPIVACDVGGVKELVSERAGMLLSQTATPQQIAGALRTVLTDGRFDTGAVKAEWRAAYDAKRNHNRFAEALLELHHKTAGGYISSSRCWRSVA